VSFWIRVFFAMSGWVTRRLVAASAAAPKPTPSLRFAAAGDASVVAWSCGRPRTGGTAGVVGLGGAAVQYQTRRFHGSGGLASALWPEMPLSTSRSMSRSMASLSSSYSSWSSSSSQRSGTRRYVCYFSSLSSAPLPPLISHVTPYTPCQVSSFCPYPCPVNSRSRVCIVHTPSSASIGRNVHSGRCILLAKSFILVG
jgi:hypothetical protein